MRHNALAPLYIVALNTGSQADDLRLLRSVGIEHEGLARGSYKGQEEDSYILSAENFLKIRPKLAERDQESVLFLDNQRNAYLYVVEDGYKAGPNQVWIGEWVEVPETVAVRHEAWTRTQGRYFIARKSS